MQASAIDPRLIHLHPDDDVVMVRKALQPGTKLQWHGTELALVSSIPAGHKIAIRPLAAGQPVRKYGQIIGFAHGAIVPGQHVHTHNLEVQDFQRIYEPCRDARKLEPYPAQQMRTFAGYARPDGRVGTRNYLGVISSVNCSASVCRQIAGAFRTPDLQRDFPHVDGVAAFTHQSGCGIQPGEPLARLRRVLAGMAGHPNITGCVLVGLGCEVNQLQEMVRDFPPGSAQCGPAPSILTIQQAGGVQKAVQAGIAAIKKLLPEADQLRRTPHPISKLVLAENCGGSDANSGLTANPALGFASDRLVRYGGTSVLAETPEIYGAEHLLVRRAANEQVATQLLAMVRWWEEHVRLHHATIDNNPAHGNKEGGLTTIYEKSLGAIAKAGQAPLQAVYAYAEPITASGLCFMDTPGFDPVSMTGLVAGGCNIGVFTTGRGSVYGCKPAPCIKVASNSPLFEQMSDDMDLNAGTILDGSETLEQVGNRILEMIIAVAAGQKTRSELNGIGDDEFAPWILGPTF